MLPHARFIERYCPAEPVAVPVAAEARP